MKITLYIFGAIMLFAFIVYAALVPVRIDSPAVGGMNSNFDIQEVQLTEATYLENVDIITTPGMLQRRFGLDTFGLNTHHIFGAFGHYEPTRFWKTIIGVLGLPSDAISDTLWLYDNSTWANTANRDWVFGDTSFFDLSNGDSMKVLGILRTTDTFGLAISGTLPTGYNDDSKQHVGYALPENYQDFTAFNGLVIHTDGSGPPSVYHMLNQEDSITIAYSPRFTGMALEAPGQPRVRVIDYTGETSLNEPVEYCYRYVEYSGASNNGTNRPEGDSGLHSIIVYPRNQSVLISGFIGDPGTDTTDGGSNVGDTRISLYRRKIRTQGIDDWTQVHSWTMKGFESNAILDTGQGIDSFRVVDNTIPTPGQAVASGIQSCTAGADFDSLYWVRFAWYDPVLDIESPMGPISAQGELVPTANNCQQWVIGNILEDNAPAPWIRVYQTLAGDAFVGSKDTLIWYRVLQSPISWLRETNTPKDTMPMFILGWLSDAQVVDGWAGSGDEGYSDDNLSPAADGSGFLRPPFIAGNVIPYSDIAYANGRLWGIGDPLFPSRLYYSQYLRMDDWFVTNYLELGGSDNAEIVAIEVLSGGTDDVLYALMRNAVYAVVGFDVERDAYLTKLKVTVGPVDKRSVITFNNQIFYLGTDMKIYRIEGKEVREISQRIEDRIDITFTDYRTAIDLVRTFRVGRDVGWIHRTTSQTIMFNVDKEVWWVNSYIGFTPNGFFVYDTLQNQSGFNLDDVVVFNTDSLKPTRFRIRGSDQVSDTGSGNTVIDRLRYQTPFIGDGEFLYEIQSINLMAEWPDGQTINVRVLDEEQTQLSAAVVTSDSRSTRLYRIGFPAHVGSYLSIRIDDNNSATDLKIHKIEMITRRVGRLALE